MIPSAITMELKCGLVCSTGEDICTYGQFPLLASTEGLLERLGFKLGEDLGNDNHCVDGDRQCSTLLTALLQPSENFSKKSEPLSDILLRALDDVRDMRHREEENEEQTKKGGNTMSRKAKRINLKVDSLEKQRAKLLEKQKKNGTEEIGNDGGDGEDHQNSADIRNAWVRIARTFNSARLLLFLFTEKEGLDMLAGCGGDAKDTGIKSLNKAILKLSDALEVLGVSSSLNENMATDDENNDNEDNECKGISKEEKSKWEKSVSKALRSRRKASGASNDTSSSENLNGGSDNVIDLTNDSVIDLTDDSSTSSSNTNDENDDNMQIESDNLSEDMLLSAPENVQVEASVAPEDVSSRINTECMPARCLYWNAHLDKLMNDLVSTVNSQSEGEDNGFLEYSFAAMSLDNDSGEDLPDIGAAAARERAKTLDKRFSLIVGITGSTEYQKRKKYLLSIEKLRHRVEQRIRHGRKNHEFEDARLDVYGSCLSGLSLGKNADVDLSLTFSEAIEKKMDFEAGSLTAKKYNRHVTDTVYKIKRKLELSRPMGGNPRRGGGQSMVEEFCDIEAVPRARVPVIKGVYMDANNPHSEDGSLHFDICLLNDIAVANSGLIKEYSDVDIRVKSLMIAVKRWTKDNKINAAQDNTLSSYTWMNMVIFYLQCIGFVPNLQCSSMMRECNHEMGWGKSRRRQDNINNLNTAYLKWNGQADRVWKRSLEVDEAYASVSMLLYGFFRFYSQDFPFYLYLVSIKRGGKSRLPKTMFPDRASLHLCIEDPFETYNSHFPHDLGTPADEGGSIFISRCFRNSEEHLRRFLFRDAEVENGESIENDVDALKELWPISTRTNESSGRSRRNRNFNDPEMTLVIELLGGKNLKKEEILELFQPFADQTGSSIVGSSITRGGRLAFVDYDSVAAAQAALAAHAKAPLKWNGEDLCVSPKSRNTAEKSSKNDSKKGKGKILLSDGNKSDSNKGNSNNKKADPDKTLVVQSISGSLSEKGIAKIFRPFAERTNTKLVTTDVTKKRNTAFIEYNSSAAVILALKEHSKDPLQWNGKDLDVAQRLPSGWKRREKIAKSQEHQTSSSQPDSQTKKKAPKKKGKKNSDSQNSVEPKPEQHRPDPPGGESGKKQGGRSFKQGRKKKGGVGNP